jgi:hypothetical protein
MPTVTSFRLSEAQGRLQQCVMPTVTSFRLSEAQGRLKQYVMPTVTSFLHHPVYLHLFYVVQIFVITVYIYFFNLFSYCF